MDVAIRNKDKNYHLNLENKNVNKEALFNETLALYQEKIYRICYGYLYEKQYAADCFQEVLINIWKSLDKFKNESSLSTYLYRITVNTTITFNKKQKSKWRSTEEMKGHFSIEATEIEEENEQLQKLRKAISELENEQRILITMVLEGIANKEIAEILGMTPNNVGVKIHRIKQLLTQRLNQQ